MGVRRVHESAAIAVRRGRRQRQRGGHRHPDEHRATPAGAVTAALPPASRGSRLRAQRPFAQAAAEAVGNTQLRRNLAVATHAIRAKRAVATAELPDWSQLRAAGAAIKDQVLADLDHYLLQLEAAVVARGGHVHWARDADEACATVVRLVRDAGADEVVKVKSMA